MMDIFACGNCGVVIPMPDCPSCAEKDAEIKRLREAIEWALEYADACGEMDTYKAELRHRAALKSAGEEGK